MISIYLNDILKKYVIEKIEDKIYLMRNKKALGKEAYKDFLEIEEVVEDLLYGRN